MNPEVEIIQLDKPGWGVIGGGISSFNKRQAGDGPTWYLCCVLEAADGSQVAGMIGVTYWNWLFIELLRVRDDLRGQGYGKKIQAMAEEEGCKRYAEYAYPGYVLFPGD